MTTYMLAHWVRDRKRGARIPLEVAVRQLTLDPAALYGFTDRGVLRPGMKGDVNVIDLDRVALRPPEMAYDLPAGAPRLLQRARLRRDDRRGRGHVPRRRSDGSPAGASGALAADAGRLSCSRARARGCAR